MAIRKTETNKCSIPPGLTPRTALVFSLISTLPSIKDMYLCGGTAISLQIEHRLSEDLDFELIGTHKDRPGLPFDRIINELKGTFPDAKTEILGSDMFLCYVNEGKVKLSFYRPENPVKEINEGFRYNNIRTPSLQDLLGMKLFTTSVRTKTRDYYDIYCLLEKGCSLSRAIEYASHLSRHQYKSKRMLENLLAVRLYPEDADFQKLQPRIKVTPAQMAERFQKAIIDEHIQKGKTLLPSF